MKTIKEDLLILALQMTVEMVPIRVLKTVSVSLVQMNVKLAKVIIIKYFF